MDFRLLNKSPLFVRQASGLTSDLVYTNAGGPEGTCLSPLLFTLYTADCWSTHDKCQTDKFADDTDHDDRHYVQAITDFAQWCDNIFLELHVGKIKR